jgi:hypothetical protein
VAYVCRHLAQEDRHSVHCLDACSEIAAGFPWSARGTVPPTGRRAGTAGKASPVRPAEAVNAVRANLANLGNLPNPRRGSARRK